MSEQGNVIHMASRRPFKASPRLAPTLPPNTSNVALWRILWEHREATMERGQALYKAAETEWHQRLELHEHEEGAGTSATLAAQYEAYIAGREDELAIPPVDLATGDDVRLHILLVDAGTGIIRAMRLVGLSVNFAGLLHANIREQAAQTWDPAAFDRALRAIYARYPESADLASAAPVLTTVAAR